jgi:hypothetical protein
VKTQIRIREPHSSPNLLIIPDSSTRSLWQLPAAEPSSETGEIWREMAVNFAREVSLFILVGFFNM